MRGFRLLRHAAQAAAAVDGERPFGLAPARIAGEIAVAEIVMHQLDEFRPLIILQRLAQFLEEFRVGRAGALRRLDQLGDFLDQRVSALGRRLRPVALYQMAGRRKTEGRQHQADGCYASHVSAPSILPLR
ncbi:MAG: hypothetical protein QF449_16820 [Alphaproteobacteria bacterium]|nr:hypothetical protein [Alphaproteobacteria bacterium]